MSVAARRYPNDFSSSPTRGEEIRGMLRLKNQVSLLFPRHRGTRLIHVINTATVFLMKTDGKDMKTDIKKLARAHAAAAIQVLAEIMTNADAPAGARISAAKALLDRGFGKVTAQKAQ